MPNLPLKAALLQDIRSSERSLAISSWSFLVTHILVSFKFNIFREELFHSLLNPT